MKLARKPMESPGLSEASTFRAMYVELQSIQRLIDPDY
jgi:hypothetical protein